MPYEVVKWQRGSDDLAPEGLKEVHPLGLAPVIVDGDSTIAESGSIVRKEKPRSVRAPPRLPEHFDGPSARTLSRIPAAKVRQRPRDAADPGGRASPTQ